MGYSDNPVTLERVRHLIQPIFSGGEVVWRTPPGRARWWAYRVREALRLAYTTGELHTIYRVEVLDTAHVRATPTTKEVVVPIPLEEPASPTAHVDTRQVLSDGWLQQIQRAWEEGSRRGRVYLPKAWLDRGQLLDLWEWTQTAGIIFFEADGAITLMPQQGNEDAALFAWSPEDLED